MNIQGSSPEFVTMFLDEARLAAQHPPPERRRRRSTWSRPTASSSSSWSTSHGETLVAAPPRRARRGRARPAADRRGAIVPARSTASTPRTRRRATAGQPLDIVHRDVSPQNILVGVDGVARVLDFGVAKATGRVAADARRRAQGQGRVHGARAARTARGRRRADVYAMAIVLWEMLTCGGSSRRRPRGSSCARCSSASQEPPSTRRPDVPAALDAVVLSALTKVTTDRYQTARQLAGRDRGRDAGRALGGDLRVDPAGREEDTRGARASRDGHARGGSGDSAGRAAELVTHGGRAQPDRRRNGCVSASAVVGVAVRRRRVEHVGVSSVVGR